MYKENRSDSLCEQTVQDSSVGSSYSLLDSASSFIFCSCMRLRVEAMRQKERRECVTKGKANRNLAYDAGGTYSFL